MTDKEILTPGLLTFPNGGAINVHSHSGLEDTSEVYYARRMPGSDEWLCLRTSVKLFLAGVRQANGTRAIRDSQDHRDGYSAGFAAAQRKLLDCAQYDATMEGPVFKGWNRSALDRLRTKYEQEIRAAASAIADITEKEGGK